MDGWRPWEGGSLGSQAPPAGDAAEDETAVPAGEVGGPGPAEAAAPTRLSWDPREEGTAKAEPKLEPKVEPDVAANGNGLSVEDPACRSGVLKSDKVKGVKEEGRDDADETAFKSQEVEGIKREIKTEQDEEENGAEDGTDSEDEEEDDEDSDDEEEEEESLILETRLRRRKVDAVDQMVKQERTTIRRLTKIMKKPRPQRSQEEAALMRKFPKLTALVRKRAEKQKRTEARKLEVEDPPEKLAKKCVQLAEAIKKAKFLVAYTGAGISTAADIPDYRGPNGVWTLMDQGKDVASCDMARAQPTFTHRALFTLYKRGKLKHVVSQNCDGLHLRSGLPRAALSEIHGNMFVEICKKCRPARTFVRLFDVTERTNKNRHVTMRRCYVCGTSLSDTIVHFGEKGQVRWPINWNGAVKAAEKADVILCIGSSLKVLRRYGWLWCMDRVKRERPKLFIINLQWTPKDCHAKLKLNGKCDEVLRQVMGHLGMEVPEYCQDNDPLLSYATPLNPTEVHTTSRADIITRPVQTDKIAEAPSIVVDGEKEGAAEMERLVAAFQEDHAYLSTKEERRQRARAAAEARRACEIGAVKNRAANPKTDPLDFRTIEWPRDALYLPYEPVFEWVRPDQEVGHDAFICDCCDPAKQRKSRRREETSSEEDEEEDEEGGAEEERESGEASDTNSKASSSTGCGDGSSGNGSVGGEGKNGGGKGAGLKLDLREERLAMSSNQSSDADSPSNSKSSTPTPTPLSTQPGWFGKGRRKRQRYS